MALTAAAATVALEAWGRQATRGHVWNLTRVLVGVQQNGVVRTCCGSWRQQRDTIGARGIRRNVSVGVLLSAVNRRSRNKRRRNKKTKKSRKGDNTKKNTPITMHVNMTATHRKSQGQTGAAVGATRQVGTLCRSQQGDRASGYDAGCRHATCTLRRAQIPPQRTCTRIHNGGVVCYIQHTARR